MDTKKWQLSTAVIDKVRGRFVYTQTSFSTPRLPLERKQSYSNCALASLFKPRNDVHLLFTFFEINPSKKKKKHNRSALGGLMAESDTTKLQHAEHVYKLQQIRTTSSVIKCLKLLTKLFKNCATEANDSLRGDERVQGKEKKKEKKHTSELVKK